MKNTKLFAMVVPSLFLLGAFLLIFSDEEQRISQSSTAGVPPPASIGVPTEIPNDNPSVQPPNQKDYSLTVTKFDENFVLHYMIQNQSNEELSLWTYCTLSRLENGEWLPVPLNIPFEDVEIVLPPDGIGEEEIYLADFKKQLTSGTYRLERELNGLLYHDTFDIGG